MGKEYLKQITGDKMNRDLFEMLLSRLNNRVSGDQLLADIANQVRLATRAATPERAAGHSLRRLPGLSRPERAGRGQAGRGSRREVSRQGARADRADELGRVRPIQGRSPRPGPRHAGLQGPSPDSSRDPLDRRQCAGARHQGQAHRGRAADRLREPEGGVPGTSELPDDLFAGQPELTPPIIRPFEDVRTQLAVALAEERAQAEITDKFSKIKDDVLFPFYEDYAAALEEIDEAKKLGTRSRRSIARSHRPESARPARRT